MRNQTENAIFIVQSRTLYLRMHLPNAEQRIVQSTKASTTPNTLLLPLLFDGEAFLKPRYIGEAARDDGYGDSTFCASRHGDAHHRDLGRVVGPTWPLGMHSNLSITLALKVFLDGIQEKAE